MITIDASDYKSIEFGEPYRYDENFHGYESQRKCTDFCMTIFFILFFCTYLSFFFVALSKSNYKYLYIPTDHRGLMCGYDNRKLKVPKSDDLPDLTNKKYLFWIRPGTPGYSRSVCVEKCPSIGLFTNTIFHFNNSETSISKVDKGFEKNQLCYTYKLKNQTEVQVLATIENYSATYSNRFFCPYSTSKVIDRCFPNAGSFDTTVDDVKDIVHKFGWFSDTFKGLSSFIQALEDIYKSRWMIIVCVIIAFILTIFWLTLLQCWTGFIVWMTVLAAGASLGLLTYSLYKQWRADLDNGKLIGNYITRYFLGELNSKFLYITFWGMIFFDIAYIVLIVRMFSAIVKSTKVISHASKLFGKKPSLFVFPVFNYLLMFAWWVLIIFSMIVLFGTGIPQRSLEVQSNTVVDKIERKYEKYVNFFIFYFILALIWVSLFISYLGKTAISCVMSQIYFTKSEDRFNLPNFMVCRSYISMIRYHTGTIAFGSILVNFVYPIRSLFEAIYVKIHKDNRGCSRCLSKSCCCCMYCYRKGLVYLTKNAFITVAIHGYNFLSAAKNTFNLTMRNRMNITMGNWVGTFTLFVGRLLISISVTAVSSWLLNSNEELQFFVAPAFVIFICSYIATGVFTGVIENAIDSMFVCYMEDEERNDGVVHPMYASKGLQNFMKANSRAKENEDSALLNNVMIQPKEK